MFVANRTVNTGQHIVNDVCTLRQLAAQPLQQIRVDQASVDGACASRRPVWRTVKQKVAHILHGDGEELPRFHGLRNLLYGIVKAEGYEANTVVQSRHSGTVSVSVLDSVRRRRSYSVEEATVSVSSVYSICVSAAGLRRVLSNSTTGWEKAPPSSTCFQL